MDAKLRVRGVRNDPKEKTLRQAIQNLGGKAAPSNEMTVREPSEELGIKDSTFRRWACEYRKMGDGAFLATEAPGSTKTAKS